MREYTINGYRFEYVPKGIRSRRIVGHNLYDVYAKPSRCKVAIWQNLVDMARDLNAYNFGITSYNTFMFVVEWDCCDPDSGEWLHVKITPSNNYIGKRI